MGDKQQGGICKTSVFEAKGLLGGLSEIPKQEGSPLKWIHPARDSDPGQQTPYRTAIMP